MNLNHHVANPVLLDDGRVLFAGRNQSEYYDPKTRKFYLLDNCGLEMANGSIAVKLLDGRVLFTGGDPDSIRTNFFEAVLFVPSENTFVASSKMFAKRLNHSATLLNDGKVFIAGGSGYETNDLNIEKYTANLKSTELYNPVTNKFERGDELPISYKEHTAIKLKDGNVLLLGGFKDTQECQSEKCDPYNYDIYLFNPNLNTYKKNGTLLQGRRMHTVFYLPPNKVYLMEGAGPAKYINGNETNFYSPLSSIELFDYKAKVSIIVNKRHSQALQLKPILLPNNKILFVGGFSGAGIGYTEYSDVELYDPKLNRFEKIENSNVHIPSNSYAVLLKNNDVLISGGGRDGSKKAAIYMFSSKVKR